MQNQPFIRKHITKISLALILSSASFSAVFAQQQIKGQIVHVGHKGAIEGVSIVERDKKNNGTRSTTAGTFTLDVAQLPVYLQVSSVGYETQEVKISNLNTPLLISLNEEGGFLDEVIITGYTTQKRQSVSGSIAKINFSENALNHSKTY